MRFTGSNDIVDCSSVLMLSLLLITSCCPDIVTLSLLYQTIYNDSTASSSLVALHVRLVVFPSLTVS